ncbi:hypothetical protein [Synechococcus phage Ssp-JY38]
MPPSPAQGLPRARGIPGGAGTRVRLSSCDPYHHDGEQNNERDNVGQGYHRVKRNYVRWHVSPLRCVD